MGETIVASARRGSRPGFTLDAAEQIDQSRYFVGRERVMDDAVEGVGDVGSDGGKDLDPGGCADDLDSSAVAGVGGPLDEAECFDFVDDA